MSERAIILSKGNILGINDFQVKLQEPVSTDGHPGSINLEINEINLIRKALKKSKFNQQSAADALGIHRDALSRKMKKYNINISKNDD
jgi:transcriptional regulator with PAS, ATPase and Fis domain